MPPKVVDQQSCQGHQNPEQDREQQAENDFDPADIFADTSLGIFSPLFRLFAQVFDSAVLFVQSLILGLQCEVDELFHLQARNRRVVTRRLP